MSVPAHKTRQRIDRDTLFLLIAHSVAERATCQRARVGAVIVKGDRIVSMGYNGSLPGEWCGCSAGFLVKILG